MNKNNPEYKTFMAQKHRFEFNDCEFKYNDKPFSLGMTIKEMEGVFGKKYIKKYDDLVKYWEGDNFFIWFDNKMRVSSFRVYLKENVVLIDDVVLDSKIKMQGFIKKSSKLTFDDFFIHDDGYHMPKEKCDFFIEFDSPVVFNRIGGGHLSVRGEPKLNETYPVKSISINKK